MSYLILTTTPTSYNYEHTILFENKSQLFEYYKNKEGSRVVLDLNVPCDAYRSQIELDIDIDDIQRYDYCIICEGDKRYYYFIVSNSKKGYLSNIYILLDVWNTYIYDVQLNDSFIDRCHVDRWHKVVNKGVTKYVANINRVDEGIDYGVKVYNDFVKSNPFAYDYGFIVSSSIPLGKLTSGGGGGGEGGGGSSGEAWKNGVISSQLFRMLKGYEGFAPNLYRDSGGVETIGYGTTKSELEAFNNLISNQPCQEDLCARVSYDIINKSYGKNIIDRCNDIGVTSQHQFDALVDLVYNCGVGVQNGDVFNIIEKDITNEQAIRDVWENYYIKDSQGTVLEGLKKRRKAECDIFFNNKYEIRSISKIGTNGEIIGTFEGDGWLPNKEGM